jgi:hypothetical protein
MAAVGAAGLVLGGVLGAGAATVWHGIWHHGTGYDHDRSGSRMDDRGDRHPYRR